MDDELRKMLVKIMEGQEALRLEFKEDIKDLKIGQQELKKGLIKLEDRLEDTRKTLFDGYKVNTEKVVPDICVVCLSRQKFTSIWYCFIYLSFKDNLSIFEIR